MTSTIKSGQGPRRRDVLAMLASGAAVYLGGGEFRAFAQGTQNGVLHVATNVNLSSLDPATGRSGYDHTYLYPLYDTLFEWDYDQLIPQPGLVTTWEQPDDKTLVMNLAEGVLFHDGAPLDAEAVKFNLERSKTDERSNLKADLASVETVEATGPLQVTLRLFEPNAALVLILSDREGMMYSPKAAAELGAESDRNPVGTGAYKFVSFTDHDKLILTKFEDYWRKDRQKLEGIEFSIIAELTTGLRSVIAGQNNFINALPPQQRPVLDRSDGVESVTMPTQFVNIIYLNYGRAPFDDIRVRQALNMAIDRTAFVALTDANLAEPTCSVLPKQHWAYDEAASNHYTYDPEKAKALLVEAGYGDGVDVEILGTADQRAVQRQEALIEQTSKVGFRLRFRQMSVPDATATYMGQGEGHGYLQQWTGRPDPSLTMSLLFDKESYFNAGKADPAEGRAAAQAASVAVSDLDERKVRLAELQRIVVENALACPISVVIDVTAHSSSVKGYRPNLLGKPKFEGVELTG